MQKKKSKIEGTSEKKDFSLPKSSCSLLSIIMVLFVIFLILLAGVYYSKISNLKTISRDEISKSNFDLNSKFIKNIEGQLGEEEISLSITEDELNELIKSISDFPLKNPMAQIFEDKVVVSGRTGSGIFGVGVDVNIVPKVVEGKVVYDIKEIKAGGVLAPKQISETVSKNLSGFLSSSLPSFENISVEKVSLHQKYLDVSGKRKN